MKIDDWRGKKIVKLAVCVYDDKELFIKTVIGYGLSDEGLKIFVIFNIIVLG